MTNIVALRLLKYKIRVSCWRLKNKTIFWLSLFVCVGDSSTCNCLYLFICGFRILFFSFFISYNLLFINKKLDIWQVIICTFYLWFYSRMISNSIPFCSSVFYSKITSNFILLCNLELKACQISFLMAADDIFVIRAINKVIKLIVKYVKQWHDLFLQLFPLPKRLF